jgi:hypothetical protein
MLLAVTGIAGCAQEPEDRPGVVIPKQLPANVKQSYTENTPADLQVAITTSEDGKLVLFDATENHRYFPVSQVTQRFATKTELMKSLSERLGASEELFAEDGSLDGLKATYQVLGEPIFENRDSGLVYRIAEPVLALIGGMHGIVEIGDGSVCVDPDGECSLDQYASYLEPIGEATARTHRVFGSSSGESGCTSRDVICVQFHTFFNQTWFPFPYARHGSNVQFVKGSALPSTRLTTGGSFRVGGTSVPMPTVTRTGVNSVETAVTCVMSTSCLEYRADIVCGRGSISDPDLTLSNIVTGNGPLNNPSSSTCP